MQGLGVLDILKHVKDFDQGLEEVQLSQLSRHAFPVARVELREQFSYGGQITHLKVGDVDSDELAGGGHLTLGHVRRPGELVPLHGDLVDHSSHRGLLLLLLLLRQRPVLVAVLLLSGLLVSLGEVSFHLLPYVVAPRLVLEAHRDLFLDFGVVPGDYRPLALALVGDRGEDAGEEQGLWVLGASLPRPALPHDQDASGIRRRVVLDQGVANALVEPLALISQAVHLHAVLHFLLLLLLASASVLRQRWVVVGGFLADSGRRGESKCPPLHARLCSSRH